MDAEFLKKKFQGLNSKTRDVLVKGGIVIAGLLICLLAYYATGQKYKKPPPPKEKFAVIDLGESRLQDDIRSQVQKEREEQRSKSAEQDEKLKAEAAQLDSMQKVLQALSKGDSLGSPTDGADVIVSADKGVAGGKTPVNAKARNTARPPNDPALWQGKTGPSGEPLEAKFELVGDIGSWTPPPGVKENNGDKGAKKNKKFFLPVSFIPAKLLTGVKAKTVDTSKSDPEPVLLRIQAPAVLPNEVRAQLEGCFVVAHGYGSLASERFEARTVSLNCVDYSGRSMVEADITGILVDEDGSKGLSGRPVSKMGANMGRLFLAGLVQGAGNAF
jgi:conjugal transfer pilus assembly protein TraB